MPAVPPPSRSVLLNPGPVNVHPAVRAAMSYPDACHREVEVADLLRNVRASATRLAGGDSRFTSVVVTGSGTAALEATLTSVVPPGKRVLVLDNGNYGERIARVLRAHGIPSTHLEFGWGERIDLDAVRHALVTDEDLTHVGMIHHETSTGMLNPLRGVGEIAHSLGRSLIVDAISSLGAEDLSVVDDHVDWCVGTANKCVEGLPGVSFVVARRAALDAIADHPPRTLYLDLHRHHLAQEDDAPLFTPAVQVLYALDVALSMALEEGVAARGARYESLAGILRDGMAERGLGIALEPRDRARSVTNVTLPDGVTYEELHDALKRRGYTIYGVPQRVGEYVRLSTMGQLRESDLRHFLEAFDESLLELRAVVGA
jgi:2-aminoethylphosphonate-pyruvate transaminase